MLRESAFCALKLNSIASLMGIVDPSLQSPEVDVIGGYMSVSSFDETMASLIVFIDYN